MQDWLVFLLGFGFNGKAKQKGLIASSSVRFTEILPMHVHLNNISVLLGIHLFYSLRDDLDFLLIIIVILVLITDP